MRKDAGIIWQLSYLAEQWNLSRWHLPKGASLASSNDPNNSQGKNASSLRNLDLIPYRKHGSGYPSTVCPFSSHLRARNNVICFEMEAGSTLKTAILLSSLNLSPILYLE